MNTRQELKELLSRLIAFYPVTTKQENVKHLLEFCQDKLRNACLKDSVISENKGVYMLYASTQGTKQPKLLLQAHVDVVPATEIQRAARAEGKRLYGRGVRDMLFASAIYLRLFDELKDELDLYDIAIMLTGDEEVGGANTVPHLLGHGYLPKAVILPDGGSNLQQLVVRAKGVYSFNLTVSGVAHHASRPWEGDNAALKLVRLLSELQESFGEPSSKRSTCSITKLAAGDSVNKGPGQAVAHVDIRYTDKAALEVIKMTLERLCTRYNAEISGLLTADYYENDPASPFIRSYIATAEAMTGRNVRLLSANGSSDARYFSAKGIPVIMSRPTSDGSHSDNEWVDIDSLAEFYAVMKAYVLKTARIDTKEDVL